MKEYLKDYLPLTLV